MSLTDHRFAAPDGVELAWHETGEGRPVVLLHGYFSDAQTNWIKYGHAEALVAAGFRVIMPDLRGHGDSSRPHDPVAYPLDVLANDGQALIRHLRLADYDLGGYSLGGRTVARMLVLGAKPRRAIIAGMGLSGLTDTGNRSAHWRDVFAGLGLHQRGSTEWMAEAFMKTTGGDPVALELLLDTFVDTSVADLARISVPVGVVCGADDHDNGSAQALAKQIPDARYLEIPGSHMSAVTKPALGKAFVDFLVAN